MGRGKHSQKGEAPGFLQVRMVTFPDVEKKISVNSKQATAHCKKGKGGQAKTVGRYLLTPYSKEGKKNYLFKTNKIIIQEKKGESSRTKKRGRAFRKPNQQRSEGENQRDRPRRKKSGPL